MTRLIKVLCGISVLATAASVNAANLNWGQSNWGQANWNIDPTPYSDHAFDDTDGDGTFNKDDVDDDGDGLPDTYEITYRLDPLDAADALLDADADGLSNINEYANLTNPLIADTDSDGLTDGQEFDLGLNALDRDSDSDGYSDAYEVESGSDPLLAGSKPAPSELAFDGTFSGSVFIPNVAKDGWLPLSATALSVNEDGTARLSKGISKNNYEVDWQVLDDNLALTVQQSLSVIFTSAPYDEIKEVFGYEVANQINELFKAGKINSSFFIDMKSGTAEMQVKKLADNGAVADVEIEYVYRDELVIPEEWGFWDGENPKKERREIVQQEFIYAEESLLANQTPDTLIGEIGVNILGQYQDAPINGGNLIEGVFADIFSLNGDGTATSEFFNFSFNWQLSNGKLVLESQDSSQRFEYSPYVEVDGSYLAFVEHFVDETLELLFVSQMHFPNNSYTGFTENMVSSLPLMNVAAINAFAPEAWQGDALLDEYVWGYQFKSDGTLRRGIGISSSGILTLGQTWDYTTNANNVLLSYSNSYSMRERTWKVLDKKENGNSWVFEHSIYGWDTNYDGEVTEDEKGAFIAPRFNVMMPYDVSKNESAWASLDDSDSDGLKDVEEEGLGTDPQLADTDNDGLTDGEEIVAGYNPLNNDSDSDGYSDGYEVAQGSNPLSDADKPAKKALAFDSSVNGYAVTYGATKEAWLPYSGTAYSFEPDGSALTGTGRFEYYQSQPATWSIFDDNLMITMSAKYSWFMFDDYPYPQVADKFGQTAADEMARLYNLGEIAANASIEIQTGVVSRLIEKVSDNGSVAAVSITDTNEEELVVPVEWSSWIGDTPSKVTYNTYDSTFVYGDEDKLEGVVKSDLIGTLALDLYYEHENGPAYGGNTTQGVYADVLTLADDDSVITAHSGYSFTWGLDGVEFILTSTDGSETFSYYPILEEGSAYLAYVEHRVEGSLIRVFTAQMHQADSTYANFTSNLVTELPIMQVSNINGDIASLWNGDLLEFNAIFGYQFRRDGTLRRGISSQYDDYEAQTGPYFRLGQEWNYNVTDRNVTLSFTGSDIERKRFWTVLGVNEQGIAIVFERSTYDRDFNLDGEIASDERGNFIPPRFNFIHTYDLSNHPEAWNSLPDSDGDGLLDYQEQDLGTDPNNTDSDEDGMPDGWEVDYGLAPTNGLDWVGDYDEDGLNNLAEFEAGTNPRNEDTDDDGVSDGEEVASGTSPVDGSDYPILDVSNRVKDLSGDSINEVAMFGVHTQTNLAELVVYNGDTKDWFKTFTWKNNWQVISFHVVRDINGNGVKDMGLFGKRKDNGLPELVVFDGSTKSWLKTWSWKGHWTPKSFHEVSDINGNGTRDMAMLGVRKDNGKPELIVYDGQSKNWLKTWTWSSNLNPVKFYELDDSNNNGAKEFGLLGTRKDNWWSELSVYDSQTKANLGAWKWKAVWIPKSIHTLPDINANGVADIGLYGQRKDNGKIELIALDGRSKGWLKTWTWQANWTPISFHVVDDINDNGANDMAMFGKRKSNGTSELVVYDGRLKNWLKTWTWKSHWEPISFQVLDDINFNGRNDFTMFGIRKDNGRPELIYYDSQYKNWLRTYTWQNKWDAKSVH